MSTSKYKNTASKYDTSHLDQFNTFLAQPAIHWKDPKNSELLGDLQANILKHHGKKFAEYHFIEFADGKRNAVKKWMARFAALLTSAKQQLSAGHSDDTNILSLYLTRAGYRYLGIPDNLIPPGMAFETGLPGRAMLDKEHLQPEWADQQAVHAIVLYAHSGKAPGAGQKSRLEADHSTSVKTLDDLATERFVQQGILENPLPSQYHFREGLGNPRFFPDASGMKKPVKPSGIAPLNTALVRDPGGNRSFSCGSFGALMKLHVNSGAFDKLIGEIAARAAARQLNMDADFIRAHIMGRFNDGTPLTLSEKPARLATDDFDYSELMRLKRGSTVQSDETGLRCPFHAHIRKANHRQPGAENIRIARRGVFYDEGKNEKGLLFLSFQSSLEHQFEHILNSWMLNRYTHLNDGEGNAVSFDSGPDMLFAKANASYTVSAGWNTSQERHGTQSFGIKVPEQIVTLLGGFYFFAPSLSFFKKLENPYAGLKPVKRAFLPGTETRIEAVPRDKTNPVFVEGTEVLLT
ncbi:MAG: Multifunctional dye peroxidase DyP2 [Saprospiraceae bacterium]|nr:Multifunctional dye peroxidase DyP2 [Saprospiraceae bacterium]